MITRYRCSSICPISIPWRVVTIVVISNFLFIDNAPLRNLFILHHLDSLTSLRVVVMHVVVAGSPNHIFLINNLLVEDTVGIGVVVCSSLVVVVLSSETRL